MPDSQSSTHPGWQGLLQWLASHGMDISPEKLRVAPKRSGGAGYGLFATSPCAPETLLFNIPENALLNIDTLAPHYPTASFLTAVQLITLHLFLYRPRGSSSKKDPLFGPYIAILPRSFDSHPLTWLVNRLHGFASPREQQWLESVPASVVHALGRVASRFNTDWSVCRIFLHDNPEIVEILRPPQGHVALDDHALRMDFLWAWLNVNTRCIYHRLKPSGTDPGNITLCPVLDFANHTTTGPAMTPKPRQAPPSLSVLGGSFGLLSPREMNTTKGEELFLKYGSHPNRELFIEYGFVGTSSPPWYDSCGEVDLSAIMEPMFRNRGMLGEWMEQKLRDEGYWGDWTIHTSPEPAHPSFRVVTALRLYCLFDESTTEAPDTNNALAPWQETLLGNRDQICQANEDSWRLVLLHACDKLAQIAKVQISAPMPAQRSDNIGARADWVFGNMKTLWAEELYVTSAVAQSIQNGVVF